MKVNMGKSSSPKLPANSKSSAVSSNSQESLSSSDVLSVSSSSNISDSSISTTYGDIVSRYVDNCGRISFEKVVGKKKIKRIYGIPIDNQLYKQSDDRIMLYLVDDMKVVSPFIEESRDLGKKSKSPPTVHSIEGSETPKFALLKTITYKLFIGDKEIKPQKSLPAITETPKTERYKETNKKSYCTICSTERVPTEIKKKGPAPEKLTKHQKMEMMYKSWSKRMRELANLNAHYDCENVTASDSDKWVNLVLGDYITMDYTGNILKTSQKAPPGYEKEKFMGDPKDPFFKKGLLQILKTPLYHNCFEEFAAIIEDEMETREENQKRMEMRREIIEINKPRPRTRISFPPTNEDEVVKSVADVNEQANKNADVDVDRKFADDNDCVDVDEEEESEEDEDESECYEDKECTKPSIDDEDEEYSNQYIYDEDEDSCEYYVCGKDEDVNKYYACDEVGDEVNTEYYICCDIEEDGNEYSEDDSQYYKDEEDESDYYEDEESEEDQEDDEELDYEDDEDYEDVDEKECRELSDEKDESDTDGDDVVDKDEEEYRDIDDKREDKYVCDIFQPKPKTPTHAIINKYRGDLTSSKYQPGRRRDEMRDNVFIGLPEHLDLDEYRKFSNYYNVKLRIFEESQENLNDKCGDDSDENEEDEDGDLIDDDL